MNNHFDIAYLRKYVSGKLPPSEMHAIEKASHQDELLMDLILGLEEEKQLNDKFDQKEIDSAIFNRTNQKKISFISKYRWLSIAAALLLVFGIGLTWYLNQDQTSKQITDNIIASAPADISTDTTLNTIPVDSSSKVLEEESKIATITPKPSNKLDKNDIQIVEEKKEKSIEQMLMEGLPYKNDTNRFGQVIASNKKIDEDLYGRVAGIQTEDVKVPGKKLDKQTIFIRGYGNQKKASVVGSTQILKTAQDDKKIATGRILNNKSGRPIVRASVIDTKTNQLAITDSSGQYILPLTSDNPTLVVHSVGFESKNIPLGINKIVQLKPEFDDSADLEEVVVVGYSGKSAKVAKVKAIPIVGWVPYKKYIDDAASQSLLGKGSVTLVFNISQFGRPIDFIIKKTTSNELTHKAIEIIQNGPDWIIGNDGKKIEVKIVFK